MVSRYEFFRDRIVHVYKDISPAKLAAMRLWALEMEAYEAECAYVMAPDDMPEEEFAPIAARYFAARDAYRKAASS